MINSLLIEKDQKLLQQIRHNAGKLEYYFDLATNEYSVKEKIRSAKYEIVFLGINILAGAPSQVINFIQQHNYDCLIVMVVSNHEQITLNEFMSAGAFDFLQKPLDSLRLKTILNNASIVLNLKNELKYYQSIEHHLTMPEGQKISEMERFTINQILIKNNYNMTLSAKQLGVGRSTLYRKVKKYQIRLSN